MAGIKVGISRAVIVICVLLVLGDAYRRQMIQHGYSDRTVQAQPHTQGKRKVQVKQFHSRAWVKLHTEQWIREAKK